MIWSLILCLLGRACNIFPLAILVNRFREHQITRRMMFIMWFSGLRGAISYALSLHLEFSEETRHVIITTTLIIVLFTTLIFGGSTMPLMKVTTTSQGLNTQYTSGRRMKFCFARGLKTGVCFCLFFVVFITSETSRVVYNFK